MWHYGFDHTFFYGSEIKPCGPMWCLLWCLPFKYSGTTVYTVQKWNHGTKITIWCDSLITSWPDYFFTLLWKATQLMYDTILFTISSYVPTFSSRGCCSYLSIDLTIVHISDPPPDRRTVVVLEMATVPYLLLCGSGYQLHSFKMKWCI